MTSLAFGIIGQVAAARNAAETHLQSIHDGKH
jgi:hypothetical protein